MSWKRCGIVLIFTSRRPPHRVSTLFALYIFLLWPAFRFLWLRIVRSRELNDEERRAVVRAADGNAPVFAAHVLLVLFVSLVLLPFLYAGARWVMVLQGISAIVLGLLVMFYPAVQWSRTILADRSRRIFPRRYTAMALLLFLSIATYIAVAVASLWLPG